MAEKRRTPTQARAARTRAALVEAAAAEFSEKGYAATTARSIAVRAGAATGSFYQYFNDKDEVLLELYVGRLERVREAAERVAASITPQSPPNRERARHIMTSMVQLVVDLHREDPKLHAVITEREHADERMRSEARRAMGTLIEAIATLLTHFGYQGDVLARAFLIFSLVEGSVHGHVLGDAVISERRFKRDLVDALDALTAHQGSANA